MQQSKKKYDKAVTTEEVRMADEPETVKRQIEKDLGVYRGAIRHEHRKVQADTDGIVYCTVYAKGLKEPIMRIAHVVVFSMVLLCVSSRADHIEVADSVRQNTVWDTDSVLVTGKTVITDGVIVSIAPGTHVFFTGFFKLIVDGTLHASATEADSIVFTAKDTSLRWHGIRYYATASSNDSSIFEYCRFSHAQGSGGAQQDNNYGGAFYVSGFNKLRISNCTVVNNLAQQGGGIYAQSASIVVDNTRMYDNSAFFDGGGIYCKESGLKVDKCVFYGNSALNGGGIFAEGLLTVRITHSKFRGNYADRDGGAVNAQRVFLSHCVVDSNIAADGTGYGGGVYCWERGDIINNQITNNTALEGGGLYVDVLDSDTWTNNTIAYNHAFTSGGGIYFRATSPTCSNMILWGNTAGSVSSDYLQQVHLYDASYTYADPDFFYCIVQGGVDAFEGNGAGFNYSGTLTDVQDANPLFNDSTHGDFTLKPASPCIDSGTPDTTGLMVGALDASLQPRTVGRIDIGAYEYQGPTSTRTIISNKGNRNAKLIVERSGSTVIRIKVHFPYDKNVNYGAGIYTLHGMLVGKGECALHKNHLDVRINLTREATPALMARGIYLLGIYNQKTTRFCCTMRLQWKRGRSQIF